MSYEARLLDAATSKAGGDVAPVPHVARVVSVEGSTVTLDFGNGTTSTTSEKQVHVVAGDMVETVVQGRRLVITANYTHPATDDSKADEALDLAQVADAAATQAQLSADAAGLSASTAQASADSATAAAASAWGHADSALTAAGAAWDYAADAASAAAAADAKADAAATSAAAAQSSATRANAAASDALTQLSVVEDVAGTLAWVSEHGTFTLTTDTEPAEGTVYFELVGGDYVPVAQPSGDPSAQGWYVLDLTDSQSEYIMAHLAVTSAGLWVLPSGMGQAASARYAPGYKLLLASDGAYLYDASGHLVTTYGESITFDSSRPQHIGGEQAYIAYYDSDGDGVPDSIYVGGSRVTIGGRTLTELEQAIEDASEARRIAEDVAVLSITSTRGQLFKNGSESTTLQVAVFPSGGDRLDTIEQVRERFGAGAYIEWRWMHESSGEWGTLVSSDPHISRGGMWLTVTPADVASKTSFSASLVVP